MKKKSSDKRKFATVRRLEDDKFEVYFSFSEIPIVMNASYLSQLLHKNQIIIQSFFNRKGKKKQQV